VLERIIGGFLSILGAGLIILILFFLPLLLQITAGDNGNNTYILPARSK